MSLLEPHLFVPSLVILLHQGVGRHLCSGGLSSDVRQYLQSMVLTLPGSARHCQNPKRLHDKRLERQER